MQKVNDLSELVNGSRYVDCFTTTDIGELVREFKGYKGILGELGFRDLCGGVEDQEEVSIISDYIGFADSNTSLEHSKTGLRIDCVEIIPSSPEIKKEFGFIPMTQVRIYTKGHDLTNELIAIFKALNKERQNIAFVNDKSTKTYVKLSEFYELEKFESLKAWLESRALPSDLY